MAWANATPRVRGARVLPTSIALMARVMLAVLEQNYFANSVAASELAIGKHVGGNSVSAFWWANLTL